MSANRRVAFTALAAGVLCAAAGCMDALFAPGAPLRQRTELAIATTAASLGGSAAAFDKADAIRVRVSRAAYPVLDSTLAFRSAGDETRVRIAVEPESSPEAVDIQVDLSSAGLPLFGGSARATLTRGETTPVAVELAPVATALRASPVPTFTALGDTAWAQGAVVFSTGDTIRAWRPTWTSLTPAIVSAGPDGMLVARAEGQGQIVGSYNNLMQTVPVTVSATVASVVLTPRDVTLYIGAAPAQFAAVARDRRGNTLVRTIAYASRDTTIAQISATGLAWAARIGATYFVAAVGAVRDSTRVTVPGGGPIPPGPFGGP